MKQKSIERILYSTVGVAAMALIAIAFNIITSAAKARVDLTKEKARIAPGPSLSGVITRRRSIDNGGDSFAGHRRNKHTVHRRSSRIAGHNGNRCCRC